MEKVKYLKYYIGRLMAFNAKTKLQPQLRHQNEVFFCLDY